MPLNSGTRLGPYEILSLAGVGGMGEVYKARDTRLDRPVAIKVSAERFNERFESEAHAIAALNHAHICTLYDVGPNYLVMEYIEGETLRDCLKRGPVSVDRALNIGIEVAAALNAAHRHGIIHRDLKPGNIMLTEQGTKLLDFGLAIARTVSAADLTATLTRQAPISGTLQYMSPEQLEGKAVDFRSDIFAFGAVLYEMVAGRRAFQGDSTASTITAICRDEPAAVREVAKSTHRNSSTLFPGACENHANSATNPHRS
jgi:serine/threonine protein kinase